MEQYVAYKYNKNNELYKTYYNCTFLQVLHPNN